MSGIKRDISHGIPPQQTAAQGRAVSCLGALNFLDLDDILVVERGRASAK